MTLSLGCQKVRMRRLDYTEENVNTPPHLNINTFPNCKENLKMREIMLESIHLHFVQPLLSTFCFPHQRAQEEVNQKEQKVNLLTDKVNSFIAKAPPAAHDSLKAELDILTGNYQHLCSRLNGKSKTLQVPILCLLFSLVSV